MNVNKISIPRPDDWHVHLRDDALLAAVIADTARTFGRAIVMPNLKPAVTTARAAAAYRARIEAQIPLSSNFRPLMTCYLTDTTDAKDLRAGFEDAIFVAAKLYPAGTTTNADTGVTELGLLTEVLEVMQELGMPLLIHGEVVDPEIDIFDREAVFIERVLAPLTKHYPALRIVFEHVTTTEAVEFVKSQGPQVAATITPHHLMINRNALFRGGIRPHYYCLPVAKREHHRQALRAAAISADPKFFLGTDSAPHPASDKESDCGCAGVYNSATAMSCYAQVFDEENSLDRLAGFASMFGADFYGLARNTETLSLKKGPALAPPDDIGHGNERIIHFVPDEPRYWEIVEDDG
jgi:dihydroorotase